VNEELSESLEVFRIQDIFILAIFSEEIASFSLDKSMRVMSCLPASVTAYLDRHVDSIPKLLNHLVFANSICNFFLFIASFQSALLPNLGLDTLLISILLCFQNIFSWIVLNNGRLPHTFQALAPSEFIMGVVLGIAVGGSILAFVLSLFFGRMSKCIRIEINTYEYVCEHKSLMMSIWFWAGLVFWLNTGISILIAIGRDELIYLRQGDYETIHGGISMDEFQSSFERFNAQAQADADFVQVGEAVLGENIAEAIQESSKRQKKSRKSSFQNVVVEDTQE